MKVLHVVHNCLPGHSAGYTLRTHRIVRAQIEAGLDASVISAGYHNRNRPSRYEYKRVNYETTSQASAGKLLGWKKPTRVFQEVAQARNFAKSIISRIRDDRPDVLHAHSPATIALATDMASRETGVPWVYEVRGMQEESAVANGAWKRRSLWYQTRRQLETLMAKRAPVLLTISRTVAKHFVGRGIDNGKILIVPNCVDSVTYRPSIETVEHPPTIGYFGAVRPLEGVEYLIRAMPHILDRRSDVLCAIVGSRDTGLIQLANHLNVGNSVKFLGRMLPSAVPDLYHQIDAFAVPRPDIKVARLVTPLKPLEALASAVPVIASDLPALREVCGASTKFVPPQDPVAIADAFFEVKDWPEEWKRLGRDWVQKYRKWSDLVPVHREAYARSNR